MLCGEPREATIASNQVLSDAVMAMLIPVRIVHLRMQTVGENSKPDSFVSIIPLRFSCWRPNKHRVSAVAI